METCVVCEAPISEIEILPSYDDDAFGIPITIKNAVQRHVCPSCGFDGIEIPDSEGLEAAVAVGRIMIPVQLSGPEIKFLRKACGMNGKQFSEAMHVDNAVLSRWEKHAGQGEVTDRTIRDVVWGLLCRKTPAIVIPPGHFTGMNIRRAPNGYSLPRIVVERVRLKDALHNTKSDEWDLLDLAA
ncbi:hypothetical protein [Azospirillum doebereinerae]|uniref:HTH cro/C1-type domain-containing protein n=1 Tax=Azospirillum doebereinerae TaxID=92933 RepID=A0A3S0VKQ4_9PROT|nr:hypothetical protein [Azospirillum doebereinerae]RUQ75063.1 hypothetical protein EJ913_04175 [Azospirillum doebereinerae]